MFKKSRISEKEIILKKVISHLCFELYLDVRELDAPENKLKKEFIDHVTIGKTEEELKIVLESVVMTDDNALNAFHIVNSINYFLRLAGVEEQNFNIYATTNADKSRFYLTMPYTRYRFRFNPSLDCMFRDLCGIINFLLLAQDSLALVVETHRWLNIADDVTEEEEMRIKDESLGFNLLTLITPEKLSELKKAKSTPPVYWSPIIWVKPPMNYSPSDGEIEDWRKMTGFKFRVIEPDPQ